jgi:hypothetical protein
LKTYSFPVPLTLVTIVAATIDAVVVATAEAAGGGVILLTSDPGGISALAQGVTETRIRPVRVS